MDDLINENIKDIAAIERKNKSQINIYIDSLLEFVTRSINMFYSMNFLSGLKCLFEMAFIAIILLIIGIIASNAISIIVTNIFSFLPYELLRIIKSVIEGIANLAWIILSLMILIHAFKIRYLNYYEQTIIEGQDKEKKVALLEKDTLKKEKIKFENKTQKIIFRDKEPFVFLNVFAKITLWFVKALAVVIGLFFAFLLLLGVIGLVISITLSTYTQIFVGLDISIVGLIIAIVSILIMITHFIIGEKIKIKSAIIAFFASIIITGIGSGIMISTIKDIEIKDNLDDIIELKTNEMEISYKNNLVIVDIYPRSYEYIIDNSLVENQIIIKNEYDPRFYTIDYYTTTEYGVPQYNFYLQPRFNPKEKFKMIINDLKNNIIRNYDSYLYHKDVKIVANKETVDKLINNFSRIYVFDKKTTATGYLLTNISDRFVQVYSECSGEYNALTGEITSSSNCKCIKEEKANDTTNIIEYSCHYIDDDE